MIARGSDGLLVRLSGAWTREKLAYLQRYAQMFMTAMAPKRRQGLWSELVYMDFLAGPGRGLDRATKAEFDVLYLFPGGIGVARNVATFAKRSRTPLDDLIPGWRNLPRARLVAGQRVSAAEMESADRPFVEALQARMAELGYRYRDTGEPYFTNDKRVKMYHLLFFSQHVAGLTLWKRAKSIEPSGQRRLPL